MVDQFASLVLTEQLVGLAGEKRCLGNGLHATNSNPLGQSLQSLEGALHLTL